MNDEVEEVTGEENEEAEEVADEREDEDVKWFNYLIQKQPFEKNWD